MAEKKVKYFFLFLCCFQQIVFAQNTKDLHKKIDSLEKILKIAGSDSTRINTLNRLSLQLFLKGEYEKSIHYSEQAITEASKLPYKIKNYRDSSIAKANNNIGKIFLTKGDYDKAINHFERAVKIQHEIADKDGIAYSYNNIGNCLWNKGNPDKALEFYFRSLKIREEINTLHPEDKKNLQGMAASYGNIGLINSDKGNYDKAIEFYLKGLKVHQEIKNSNGIAVSYNNIGVVYRQKRDYEKAMAYFFKALKIYEEAENKMGMAYAYGNIGFIDYNKGNINEALRFNYKSLKLFEELNDKQGMTITHNLIGDLYLKQKNIVKAKENQYMALTLAKELNAKPRMQDIFLSISHCDSAAGDYKEAYNHHKIYTQIKDSIFNAENTKQITEISTKYESEKKDNEIKLLSKDKDVQQQRQKFTTMGLALLVVIAGILFYAFYNKKKANEIIISQKMEVEHQKELVDEKNKEITDSITYAKRIQQAILPPDSHIKKYFPESFVLYKPKDIVAGDFYWMETNRFENLEMKEFEEDSNFQVFLAAADCTGHGVPGAMVSVVCSNALNRSVKEFKITDPGLILDKTTELVVETFDKSEHYVRDGMDISLLSINFQRKEIKWAGANNPLRYIHKGTLQEIAANKQPVGKHENRKPFTTHTLQLNKGDTIYLFSDGFTDQFGGPDGKKFMTKRFKEMLSSFQHFSMIEQQQFLEKTFEEWKGNREQVDDILIMGIKV